MPSTASTSSARQRLEALHEQIRNHEGSQRKLRALEKQLVKAFIASRHEQFQAQRKRSARARRLEQLATSVKPSDQRLLLEMAALVRAASAEDLTYANRVARDTLMQ